MTINEKIHYLRQRYRGETALENSPAQLLASAFSKAMTMLGRNPNMSTQEVDIAMARESSLHVRKVIGEINKTFGSDPEAFETAMTLFGKEPSLNVEQLKTEVLKRKLNEVNLKLKALKAEHAVLTSERDSAAREIRGTLSSLFMGHCHPEYLRSMNVNRAFLKKWDLEHLWEDEIHSLPESGSEQTER